MADGGRWNTLGLLLKFKDEAGKAMETVAAKTTDVAKATRETVKEQDRKAKFEAEEFKKAEVRWRKESISGPFGAEHGTRLRKFQTLEAQYFKEHEEGVKKLMAVDKTWGTHFAGVLEEMTAAAIVAGPAIEMIHAGGHAEESLQATRIAAQMTNGEFVKMTHTMFDLQMHLAASSEEAALLTAELSRLKIGRIEGMAEATFKASKILGIGTKEAAIFGEWLHRVGDLGVEGSERVVAAMSHVSRAFALAAGEVKGFVVAMEPLVLRVPKEFRENMLTSLAAVGGALAHAGINANDFGNAFKHILSEDTEGVLLLQEASLGIGKSYDELLSQVKRGELRDTFVGISNRMRSLVGPDQVRYAETLSKNFGMSAETLLKMVDAGDDLTAVFEKQYALVHDNEKMTEEFEEAWHRTIDTLDDVWKHITRAFHGFMASVGLPFVRVLGAILHPIAWVLSHIVDVFAKVNSALGGVPGVLIGIVSGVTTLVFLSGVLGAIWKSNLMTMVRTAFVMGREAVVQAYRLVTSAVLWESVLQNIRGAWLVITYLMQNPLQALGAMWSMAVNLGTALWGGLISGLSWLGTFIAQTLWPAMLVLGEALWGLVVAAWNFAIPMIIATWPFLLIAAIIAGIVWLVIEFWDYIKLAGEAVFKFMFLPLFLIYEYWDDIISIVGKVGTVIKRVFMSVWQSIKDGFCGIINMVIDAINGLIGFLVDYSVFGLVAKLFGKTLSSYIPKIPHVSLAEGGVVAPRPGGTLAQVGEGGEPEAVVPLSKAPEFGFGGGDDGAAKIVDAIRESTRQVVAAVMSAGSVGGARRGGVSTMNGALAGYNV